MWIKQHIHLHFYFVNNNIYYYSIYTFIWLHKYIIYIYILPPTSEGWGKVIFSVCVSIYGGGGYPRLVSIGRVPLSCPCPGVPHPDQTRVLPPIRTGWGGTPSTIRTGWRYPPVGTGGTISHQFFNRKYSEQKVEKHNSNGDK